MSYTALIVDDEKPARDLLAAYAAKLEEVVVVAVLDNALDAKRIINTQKIDILITDIQMEDLTGIDLLKTLKKPPVTIFTTAYSEYALEGYDLDVIDYLVKPISFHRFCKAIDKATELIQFNQPSVKPTGQAAAHTAVNTAADFFFVRTNRKLVKVRYQDILFVQSYGEYVKLYTNEDVILALQTTNFMEQQLPANDFFRIHRSHIVNVNQIQEIEGNQVRVAGHTLVVSKRLREPFLALIEGKGII